MSKANISPPSPKVAASSTSEQASDMSMKYRMMRGWVTRTGPPRRIWSRNMGITEPFEPSTLPNRVVMNCVRVPEADSA